MIVVQALLMMGVAAADFRIQPLDERTGVTVRVSLKEPTTCVFPGPISALEGAQVSRKTEDNPPVLLSHQPGANYFSLRALKEGAHAALNVIYRGRVYALTFVTAEEPDRAVVFEEPAPLVPMTIQPLSAETLRSLLHRAKNHDLVTQQYPLLARGVERNAPASVTRYPGFTAVLAEVFRFEAEDVLIFRVRLENATTQSVRFDPSGLAVRVGAVVYPAALAEAEGIIPANGSASAWIVVAGDGHGGRANLAVLNRFTVLVPTVP